MAEKIKELLLSGVIGDITQTDFHWYPDTSHGADYFRRWHAYKENSGSLFVHKATHHFDLINWYLQSEPVEVFAHAALRHYGRNGAVRATNCRTCPHTKDCKFYRNITRNDELRRLYVECESDDGYLRDACVFRADIDIYDTMTATMKYASGALLSYSLNCAMPYEGYHLSFNGTQGRIEVRCYERQPWTVPGIAEIRVSKNFGKTEVITLQGATAGHFGADPRLHAMVFNPSAPDPLQQRACSCAGALSLLTGVAARKSVEQSRAVKIAELMTL